MLHETENPISTAIDALKSGEPKSLRKQTNLQQYVEDLRMLKHRGYTNSEIISSFKAHGVRVSQARLRKVLNTPQSGHQRRQKQHSQDQPGSTTTNAEKKLKQIVDPTMQARNAGSEDRSHAPDRPEFGTLG
jgi:hypothetical protein